MSHARNLSGALDLKGKGMSFVGDIFSGLIDADSNRHAANQQADSVRDSNALQERMFNQTREDQTPYRQAGYGALQQIQNLLQNPNSIAQQPGYQFGLDQGARALNSGAAARGMNYSGAQAKALTRYGQDYAGTKLNETYNRLSNLAGLGQVAVNGQNNQNYANNVGANTIGLGNAQAAATLRTGSGYANAANSLASWAGRSFGGGDGGIGGFSMSDLINGTGLGGGL